MFFLLLFSITFAICKSNKIQIISGSECNDFFDWQSAGVVHSWHKSNASKTNKLTRVVGCDHMNVEPFDNEEIVIYKSYTSCESPLCKSRSGKVSVQEILNDPYPAYNKPGFVIEWIRHREKTGKDVNGKAVDGTQYVVIIDADMLITRPIDPQELGVRKGHPIGSVMGYMFCDENDMIKRHLDEEFRKYCSKVGGISIWHYEDLRKIIKPWLEYTIDVRHDPLAWKDTGDVYAKDGDKPWISEMYGYVYGIASQKIKIKEDPNIQLYPTYRPNNPLVIHYGIEFKIGENYSWNKHWYHDKRLNPPKLFEDPPDSVNEETKYAVDTIHTLNEAFIKYSSQKTEL